MLTRLALVATAVLLLSAPAAHAKPPPAKQAAKPAAGKKLPANAAKVKELLTTKNKVALGLPYFSSGRGYSGISTKWLPEFRVSPPVDWVTDSNWVEGTVYTVKITQVKKPDGKVESIYTPEQKKEVFSNLIGHIYGLKGPAYAKWALGAEGKDLLEKWTVQVDDGTGFNFPMAIHN